MQRSVASLFFVGDYVTHSSVLDAYYSSNSTFINVRSLLAILDAIVGELEERRTLDPISRLFYPYTDEARRQGKDGKVLQAGSQCVGEMATVLDHLDVQLVLIRHSATKLMVRPFCPSKYILIILIQLVGTYPWQSFIAKRRQMRLQ
jgi:hypothetical protein